MRFAIKLLIRILNEKKFQQLKVCYSRKRFPIGGVLWVSLFARGFSLKEHFRR